MKLLIAISMLFLLCACSTQPLSYDEPQAQAEPPVSDLEDLAKLADNAYQLSDWTKSEEYYLKLVNSHPGQALYWYRLGNIYAYTNRTDAAIIAYQQAISLAPEDARTWFNLGMAHLKLASHSFNAAQGFGDPNTPTTLEGVKLLEGILELLEQGQ